MKIVFFGASNFVLPVIEVLQKNFKLELVITTEKLESDPVIKYCTENKIPYSSTSSKEELKSLIINHQSLGLGVVADFGVIIPKEILNLFTYGVLNIHPSLLPKYRGSTPIQTALVNGDKTTGVTIIKLDEHMDHGQILLQQTESINPNDTAQSLYRILFQKAALILKDLIPKFINNEIELRKQDHAKATFTKALTRNDGFINVASFPNKETLENKIKAYYPWPGVWTRLRLSSGGQAKIVKFLPNKKIQVEGKKEMSYKDFLNGYPNGEKLLRAINLI